MNQGSDDMAHPVSKVRSVLVLGRPHFLIPGFFLFALGFMVASLLGGDLDMGRFLLGYAVMMPAHLAVSYSNDYFDVEADALSRRNSISGGSGVLVERPELRPLALRMALALMLLSATLAIIFQIVYDPAWYFMPLAWAGNLLGWAYTAPPFRLAYRGMGEIATMFAVGVAIPGLGFMSSFGGLDPRFLAVSAVLSCYGLLFILTVELPDVETDRQVGKRNLLVRYGTGTGLYLCLAATLTATLLFLLAVIIDAMDSATELTLVLSVSLLPLSASAYAVGRFKVGRYEPRTQSQLNFITIMLFLLAVDGILVWMIW